MPLLSLIKKCFAFFCLAVTISCQKKSEINGNQLIISNGFLPVISERVSPGDLNNLIAWYDAADTSSVKKTNNFIYFWKDKSGNANHLQQVDTNYFPSYSRDGSAANMPFITTGYGNKNFQQLNSSKNFLPVASPFTIYIVARQKKFEENKPLIQLAQTGRPGFYYSGKSGDNTQAMAVCNGRWSGGGYNAVRTGQWCLFKGFFKSATGYIQVNNEAVDLLSVLGEHPMGNDPLSAVKLGGAGKFDIAEMVICSDTLSYHDDTGIKKYFFKKYVLPQNDFVIGFGDSQVHGSGLTDYNKSFGKMTCDKKGYVFYNWSLPGRKVTQNTLVKANLDQLYRQAFSFPEAKYIFFAYGSNDSRPDSAWKATYKKILIDFLHNGFSPDCLILCTGPYIPSRTYTAVSKEIIFQLSRELGLKKVADFYTVTKNTGGINLLQADELHLNEEGHRVCAAELERAMK